QRRDLRVQAPRDRALRCVGGKQAVFVEVERLGGDVHGLGSGCVVLPPSGAVNGMVSLQIALPVISTAGRNPQREMNRISYRRWLPSGAGGPRARGRVTPSMRCTTPPGSTCHSLSVLAPAAAGWRELATCTLSITASSQVRKSRSPGVGSRRMLTSCG